MPTAALHGLVVAQVAGPPGLTAWGPDITSPAVVLATAGVARFLSSWHAGESLQGQIDSIICLFSTVADGIYEHDTSSKSILKPFCLF